MKRYNFNDDISIIKDRKTISLVDLAKNEKRTLDNNDVNFHTLYVEARTRAGYRK